MVTSKQKKVALFYLGALPGFSKDDFFDWLKQMPELGIIANISPFFVFEEDPVNITSKTWLKLATELKKRAKNFDGFVVLHGVNNLLATANAVAFLLPNFLKPIIFTGGRSSRLQSDLSQESGIKANLINAVQIATLKLTEVGIVSGNRLLRASQTDFAARDWLNLYEAAPSGILGKIDFSIRIFDKNLRHITHQIKSTFKLSDKVIYLKADSLFNLSIITPPLARAEGIFIDATNLSNLPKSLMTLIKEKANYLPIVIYGLTDSPAVFVNDNIILICKMTKTAAQIKFRWAVKQSKSVAKIKKLMLTNIIGELN